jgi:hypothetical protein
VQKLERERQAELKKRKAEQAEIEASGKKNNREGGTKGKRGRKPDLKPIDRNKLKDPVFKVLPSWLAEKHVDKKRKPGEDPYRGHPEFPEWTARRIKVVSKGPSDSVTAEELVEVPQERRKIFSKTLPAKVWESLVIEPGTYADERTSVLLYGWGDIELHRLLYRRPQMV